jgi:disulfide bond formation protein DsbB
MVSAARFFLRQWPLTAAVVSAVMLAIAHGFQDIGGLQPCTLCLRQREVYWAAMGVGLVGFLIQRLHARGWLVRLACIGLAVCFAYGCGLAIYHAGAEWKWWPGPQACASTGAQVSAASMLALMKGAHVQPPHCDQAAWVFLGLSMAGWNAVASAILTIASICAALCRPWLAPKAPVTV